MPYTLDQIYEFQIEIRHIFSRKLGSNNRSPEERFLATWFGEVHDWLEVRAADCTTRSVAGEG